MEKIDINTASFEELQRIIHIGEFRAKEIINRREKQRFRDLFELSNISGLGKKRMWAIINQDLAAAQLI